MTGRTVPEALDSDLGWSLGVVFRAYVRLANDLMSDLPGGPRGYQVLAATAQGVTGGQGVLAQRLGIDKTVMTYLVDDLERAGLVERRPDPSDRRHKSVVATTAGRSAWNRIRRQLDRAELHVLAPLEPAERDQFRALLQRLACAAQDRDPTHDACQLVADLDPAAPTG